MARDIYDDADLGGDYARDTHRGGYGDDYARERPFAGYRGRGPKNYRRDDARIAEEVNERLTDDPYVDASDVEVSVQDGVVHLTGRVRTRDQKRRAEDIAERCRGVHDVMNALRVAPGDQEVGIGKASE